MTTSLEDIALQFDALGASDFDELNAGARGWERLEELCRQVSQLEDPPSAAPLLLRTMERLDSAHLGSPGPLVHTLEKWRGRYEPALAESLRRKPSPLTVWMVNRILNANPPDAGAWLSLLRSVAVHPEASAATREDALHFLQYQEGGD